MNKMARKGNLLVKQGLGVRLMVFKNAIFKNIVVKKDLKSNTDISNNNPIFLIGKFKVLHCKNDSYIIDCIHNFLQFRFKPYLCICF